MSDQGSAPPPPPPPPAPSSPWTRPSQPSAATPPGWIAYGVAALPAVLAILLLAVAPGFIEPLFDPRVTVAGVPVGLLLLAGVFGLSALGVLILALARSWLAVVLVAIGLVMPAMLLLILAPAVVLIAVNLRV